MDLVSIAISLIALVISVLAWRGSLEANRIGIFRERFEVYRDAEDFIKGWNVNGKPDMDRLPKLVAAWDRSHFLFSSTVTQHLRELWLDGVKANHAAQVAAGEAGGDRDVGRKTMHDLFQKHFEYEKLRDAFKEMRVK